MSRALEIRPVEDMSIPIWEQQTSLGETSEFYSMFLTYRNIKPAERSVAAAYRNWTKGTASEGKASTSFYDVSAAFLWAERAATFDIAQLQNRYKTWGERDWMLRDEVWDAGEKIHKKAMVALEKIKDEELNLSLPEIAALLKMTTELRQAAIPGIGALNTNQIREVLSAMPESKRDAVLRIVVAEWKQVAPGDPRNMIKPMPVAEDVIEGEVIRKELTAPQTLRYPDFIEARLLREALTRVRNRVTRNKLKSGERHWSEFVSQEEAQHIANTTPRPKGYMHAQSQATPDTK